MVFHFPFSTRRVASMSYNVYFIAGDYSRQAAKAPPPRAPAAVVSTLRPKSEVRPALPITDGTASFDPPRRPPGPMSVVLEDVQKIGRPPAATSSLAPLQRPPLRSRSSRSRRPRQTRSRSDSRARSRSPGPSVSEVRSEARSLQQAHHTYPPGNWETWLGVFDIYGHSGQFQERPPPPPPPPRPVVPQTVRSAPNASLSAPLGSAPFNAFSIPSTPSGHVPLNDHEHSLFEILLNQQVKEHPTSEAFLQHVAKLLAQADILSQDLGPMRMATYDPSYYGWNQGSDQPAPWSIFTFCRSQFCMIEPTFQKECHRYQDGRHQTEASMKSSIWPSHMPQNLVILLPFSKKVSWHLANSTLQKVKVSLLRDSK